MNRRQLLLRLAKDKATHTNAEWRTLLAVCGSVCGKCKSTPDVTKDHIESLATGGSDGLGNIQPLCHRCNCGKRAPIDYRPESIAMAYKKIDGLPERVARIAKSRAFLAIRFDKRWLRN